MGAIAILILLIAVPVAEIALLIEVGGLVGTWATIGLIIATAVAGTALIRWQGLGVIADIRRGIETESPSLDPVIAGLCLLVAGALLLTPGFLTDGVGFILLVPPARRTIARGIWRWFTRHGHVASYSRTGRFDAGPGRSGHGGPGNDAPGKGTPGSGGDRHGDVIEGTFVDLGRGKGSDKGNPESPWSNGPDKS